MLGTLGKIWPWKQVLTWRESSSGEMVPLLESNLSPMQFEAITGDDAQLILAIVAMGVGVVLVWGLERFAGVRKADANQSQ